MNKHWTRNTFMIMTAATLTINTAMVSKASGWTETENGWHYEENGGYITSAWKKGQKGFYYLGDTGKLKTSSWITDGDKNYYVDSEGLRVKNSWIYNQSWNDSTDTNQYWYYFDQNGEMLTGKQQIGDKKYFFSSTGEMMTGWITFTDNEAEYLTDEITSNNTYYCLEDGSRASGWLKLEAPDDEDHSGEEYWYNFKSTGVIRRNTKATIGNHEFCFDEQGRMIEGWAYKTADTDTYVRVDENTEKALLDTYNADASRYYYCGEEDLGVIQKDIWLSIVPPGLNGDPDEDATWYYFDKRGKMMTATKATASEATPSSASRMTEVRWVDTKGKYGLEGGDDDLHHARLQKVNNTYYLFDSRGEIIDGLIYIYNKDGSFQLKEGYYYFGSKSSKTTGKVTLVNDATDYHYYFSKKRENGYSEGQGVTGVYEGKLYYKGLAVTADEDTKYKLIYIPELAKTNGTGLFVVDENGKVKTSGLTSEMYDGTKYRVKKQGSSYRVFRVDVDTKEETELTHDDAELTLDFSEPELV